MRLSLLLTLITSAQDWAGTWQGTLVNLPPRAQAKQVDVQLEIGTLPKTDNTCATWRTTYSEQGKVLQVKDYKLCRGTSNNDWFIDEGQDLKLKSKWIGDVLVTPFKYDNLMLVSTTRLRGDTLEEEILTIDDKPAIKGPLGLDARSIQRLTLTRKK
jgi:hypothetical protein